MARERARLPLRRPRTTTTITTTLQWCELATLRDRIRSAQASARAGSCAGYLLQLKLLATLMSPEPL